MTRSDKGLLKKVYFDIVSGFTRAKIGGDFIYIKHFGLGDQVDLDSHYQNTLEEIESKGIPSEAKMLVRLEKMGLWSKEDEDQIEKLNKDIKELIDSRNKVAYPSKKKYFQNIIDRESLVLDTKNKQRTELLSRTSEKIADSRLNDFFVIKSFYKDKECKVQYFSDLSYETFVDEDLVEFISIYNNSMSEINDKNIKLICLQPFFQNSFYLANSVYEFWGKPLISLTIHQSDLSGYGRYFKSVLENSETKIPDEIKSDPEKLIKFMQLDQSQRDIMEKTGDNHNVGFVGTDEDAKSMGVKFENRYSIYSQRKEAKGLGRSLSMQEMFRIDKGEDLFKD